MYLYFHEEKEMVLSKLTKPVLPSTVFNCFFLSSLEKMFTQGYSLKPLYINAFWSLSIDDFSQPTFPSYCVWNRYSHLMAALFLCWIFLVFLTKERNTIGIFYFFTSHVESGDMMGTISKSTNLEQNDAS